MTVYVDDMYLHDMGRFGRMKMSHMVADTSAELLDMARRIGVQTRWLQHGGESGEHFDIAMVKRERALDLGAVPITLRQCAMMCKRRRHEGVLGKPEEAEEWIRAFVARKVVA